MLLLVPVALTAFACAGCVLAAVLGRAGARRYGAIVPALLAPLCVWLAVHAARLGAHAYPETKSADDLASLVSWLFVGGATVVGLAATVVAVVLATAAVQARRQDGVFIKEGHALVGFLRRGAMILVWMTVALVGASVAVFVPVRWIYGDAPPAWLEQTGGFVFLGALALAAVLGLAGKLPGTRRETKVHAGH